MRKSSIGAGEAVPASFNMRVALLVWSNQAPDVSTPVTLSKR